MFRFLHLQSLGSTACKDRRLFRNHCSGISSKLFGNLLLTSRHHLEVLHQLQKYFERRNAKANYPGLIEEDIITVDSFAARFAERDPKMQEIKEKIRRLDEDKIKAKRNEVEEVREKLAQDQTSVEKMTCVSNRFGGKACLKCKLYEQIGNCRIAVHKSSWTSIRLPT